MAQPSAGITSSKAREVLRDGTIRGKPLTPAQRGMFGAAAGRGKQMGGNTGLSYRGRRSQSKRGGVPAYARGGTIPLNRRGKTENMTKGQTLGKQEDVDKKSSRYVGDGVGAKYSTTPDKGRSDVNADTPKQSSATKRETNPKGPGETEKADTKSVRKGNTSSKRQLKTHGRNDPASERGGDTTQKPKQGTSAMIYEDPMSSFRAPGSGGFVDHDDVGSGTVGLRRGGSVFPGRSNIGVRGAVPPRPANTQIVRDSAAGPVGSDSPMNGSPGTPIPVPYTPAPVGAAAGGGFPPGFGYGGYALGGMYEGLEDGGLARLRQMLLGGSVSGYRNGGMVANVGPSSGVRPNISDGSGFPLDGGVEGSAPLPNTVTPNDPLTPATMVDAPPPAPLPTPRGGGTSMTDSGTSGFGHRPKAGGGKQKKTKSRPGTHSSGGGAGNEGRRRVEGGRNQEGHGIPGFKTGGKMRLPVNAGRTEEGDEVGKLGAQGNRPNKHRGDTGKVDSVQHGEDQRMADAIRDDDMSSAKSETPMRPSGMLPGKKKGGNVALIKRLAAARRARRK